MNKYNAMDIASGQFVQRYPIFWIVVFDSRRLVDQESN